MRYRLLGNSGLAVSELCLGTMTFGNTTSESDSIQMINQFVEMGGNFIDTADVYVRGRSEEIVGKAIQPYRQDIVLATKVRMPVSDKVNNVGLSRKHIMDGIESSLRRLQTDYIDLYQVHVWDYYTPIEETLRTLDDLIRSGKVRYIGCSNFFAWQLMKSLSLSEFNRYAKFISIQPQYSLVCRDIEHEILPMCIEEKIGVLPWSPLAGGFLSGKYEQGVYPTTGRLVSTTGENTWELRGTKRNFIILETVNKIAQQLDKTATQVSLNWLIHKEGITSPIFGANTLEQFNENMGALGWQLPAELWQEINEVSAPEQQYMHRFHRKFARKINPLT